MHDLVSLIDKRLGGINFTKTGLVFVGAQEPYLAVNDVRVVEALYTTHNAHFDKHPSVQNFTLRFLGRSILFDESTENWRHRRKAMTPAFYKGKLAGLVKIAEAQVHKTIAHF